jgi:hypothetical protein
LIETVLNVSKAAIFFCDRDLNIVWFNGNLPQSLMNSPVGRNFLECIDSVKKRNQILKDARLTAATINNMVRLGASASKQSANWSTMTGHWKN